MGTGRRQRGVVQLDPVEISLGEPEVDPETPLEEPPVEPPGVAALRRDPEAARAQAMGDAYRAMSDADVARREASSQRMPSGATVYPPGTVPPPASRVDALRAQPPTPPASAPTQAPPGLGSLLSEPEASAPPLPPRSKAMGPGGRPSPGPMAGGSVAEIDPGARSRAEISDALRRPLYAIGAALAQAGGQRPAEWRSEVEGLEGARTSEQERLDELSQQQEQGRSRAAQLGMQREQMDASQRAREDELSLRREQMTAQGERSDAELALRREQMAGDPNRQRIMAALEEQRALQDPASDVSRLERERVRAQLALLPEPLRAAIPEERLEQLSGVQLRALASRIPVPGVRTTGAGPRGGGTGGGGPAIAQLGQSVEALAREAGMSDAEIAAFGSNRRDLERLRQAALGRIGERRRVEARRGADAEGVEIIPGVRSTLDLGTTEVRSLRQGLSEGAGHMAAIRQIDEIARRYGSSAVIDPRIEAELVAPTQQMMAMVATLRNTGVINPGEAPTIEAAIPNPRGFRQQSFGNYQRRVESFRRLLLDRASANLAAAGVDEAGIQRALGFLRSGRVAPGGGAPSRQTGAPGNATREAPPAAETVRVRLPSGRTATVPADRARNLPPGWQVVNGP